MAPVKSIIILLISVLLASALEINWPEDEPDPNDYEDEMRLNGPISINIKGKR